jgi:hypothetical protein
MMRDPDSETDDAARPAPEIIGLRYRLAGLRSTVGARSVLVAGHLAGSRAMQKLLRMAGARVMAAEDLDAALHLVRRFPIEIIISDGVDEADELEEFEGAVKGCRGAGAAAMFVRLPPRAA